jgi:hypothetical protein
MKAADLPETLLSITRLHGLTSQNTTKYNTRKSTAFPKFVLVGQKRSLNGDSKKRLFHPA